MEPKKEKILSVIDVRIAIAVAICALTATLLNHFDLKFAFGTMKLEIIQKMTACTLSGYARMWYALFRLISTFYGVLVVLLVSWIAQKIGKA